MNEPDRSQTQPQDAQQGAAALQTAPAAETVSLRIGNPPPGAVGPLMLFLLFLGALVTGRNDLHAEWSWLGAVLACCAVGIWLLWIARVLFSLRRATLVVGSDGVFLARPWATDRFISYAQLEEQISEPAEQTGRVHVKGEQTMTITCLESKEQFMLRGPLEEISRAHCAMKQQREQFVRHSKQRSGATSVERQSRSAEQWIDELRSSVEGAHGHRQRATPRDHFWEALDDPSHDPAERAAAALALKQTLERRERQRIRILANSTASPKLRIVLDEVLEQEHDDHAALEALESLSKRKQALR